jgi:hypothetical protein
MPQRKEAAAALLMKVSDGVERRHKRGAGRRRSFFSVPRSGSEAQGAEEQRKKKALWG